MQKFSVASVLLVSAFSSLTAHADRAICKTSKEIVESFVATEDFQNRAKTAAVIRVQMQRFLEQMSKDSELDAKNLIERAVKAAQKTDGSRNNSNVIALKGSAFAVSFCAEVPQSANTSGSEFCIEKKVTLDALKSGLSTIREKDFVEYQTSVSSKGSSQPRQVPLFRYADAILTPPQTFIRKHPMLEGCEDATNDVVKAYNQIASGKATQVVATEPPTSDGSSAGSAAGTEVHNCGPDWCEMPQYSQPAR